jgi:Trk-type K+ transport system membrane component
MLHVQIIFTTLSALALARKFLLEHSERAELLLIPLIALVVLLLVLSPATRPD